MKINIPPTDKKRIVIVGCGFAGLTLATDCDNKSVTTSKGGKISTGLILWTAGISGNKIKGFPQENYGKGGRFLVDRFNKVRGNDNIFAIGISHS